MSNEHRIPKIVLTGGPCGGKSTAQAMLRERLTEYGITPLIVPEVSTHLYMTNFRVGAVAAAYPERLRDVQREILRYQLMFEDRQEALCRILSNERTVLICDRGAMDSQAYIGRDRFAELISGMGLTIEGLRDKRYQAVCHITTAAKGAEEFYSLDNPARGETLEEARVLDDLTLQAWVGHEHLKVVRNVKQKKRIDFETKKNEILRWVCHTLGIPEPLEIERKYLVDFRFDPSCIPVPVHKADIKQVYLLSQEPGIARRIRMRHDLDVKIPGEAVYTYTEKVGVSDATSFERERIISSEEYLTLLAERDLGRVEIRKHRYSFVYESQYFQFDVFLHPQNALMVLEVELTDENQDIDLPSFLPIVRDVTSEPAFKNINLASSIFCPGC